ncbi:MAG: hypothetical protein ACR2NP_14795, partial [Pirellulaceae bacterium]
PLVDPNDLQPIIQRQEYYEWRSLAILLLAQNPTPDNRKLIENSYHSCVKFSISTNLAAWATAYIELHGHTALDEIERTWFRDGMRSDEEMRAVSLALAAHGINETELRELERN